MLGTKEVTYRLGEICVNNNRPSMAMKVHVLGYAHHRKYLTNVVITNLAELRIIKLAFRISKWLLAPFYIYHTNPVQS